MKITSAMELAIFAASALCVKHFLPACGRFYLSARVPVLLRQKVPQYENHLSYQGLMEFYRFLKIWADVMHTDWCELMRANDRGIR